MFILSSTLAVGGSSEHDKESEEDGDELPLTVSLGEQFDSTALFHWCKSRSFESSVLVSMLQYRMGLFAHSGGKTWQTIETNVIFFCHEILYV